VEAPTFALYLAIFLVSLALSSLLVPLLRKIAFRYSVLDRPNQSHKTHQESIPYLGGFAIVIPVSLLVIVGPLIFVEDLDYSLRTALFLLPAVLLALVGLYDDMKSLSASSRFFVQSLIAVCATLYLSKLGYSVSILSNEIGNLLLSIFWLVGITNAFNFFDNLDGGATGITLVASLTLFLLGFLADQYLISSISLALAGAGLGFLWWNKNPARIYLGDSGALFIGFILAISLLQFEPNVESRVASALVPVFILALPIIDTSVAVVSRLLRGVSIFQGGRDHLSHRLISLGFSRRKTAYSLWGLSALLSSLTFLISDVSRDAASGISLLGMLFMGFLVIWFLRIEIDA
jgi:UDP-GlcNAc:undecaprenyl-phosphate/decaprenyl-phosphate GlcNAc-1-phosphate transferase